MKLIKIKNIKKATGDMDYKGLDIDKFKTGSHVYADDLSYCIVATDQDDIPKHADISVVSNANYVKEKKTKEEKDAEKELRLNKKRESVELATNAVDELLGLTTGGSGIEDYLVARVQEGAYSEDFVVKKRPKEAKAIKSKLAKTKK